MSDIASTSDWDESPDTASSEPAAVPVAPAVPASTEQAAPESAGPDDDESGEGPDTAEERDRRGRFRPRGRAKSQQAGADDVPRIRELTRRLRTVEQELQTERATKAQPAQRPTVPYVPPVQAATFNEPEPRLEQFADKDDPYGAWQRELARFDRRKERFDEQNQHAQQSHQRTSQEVTQYYQQAEATHKQRLMAAAAANPEHLKALQSVKVQPPPLLDWAIMLDNQSAEVALFLATHPHVLDEFALMTAVQPVTEQTVATTQRLLRQRMSAVSTGAVASSPVLSPAPRPLTPVRTAPMKSGEPIPGENDSIESHEAFFHRNKPGRRH